MVNKERIEQIKSQIQAIQINPKQASRENAHTSMVVGDAYAERNQAGYVGQVPNHIGTEDVIFLISEIERLELINGQLVQHNQELIAEMENVRADFGGDHR